MIKKLSLVFLLLISIFSYSEIIQVKSENLIVNSQLSVQENSVNINEVSNFKNIVIFIRFQDEDSFVAPSSYTYYDNLFNSLDQVSLRDYYLEASYGLLDITTIFATPTEELFYYVDSFPRSYYQDYDEVDNPNGVTDDNRQAREHLLLKNAIDYIDSLNLIDSGYNLDTNDDGEIDSITFLVSGEAEGWNSLLWPHKWSLSTYYNFSAGEFYNNAPAINGLYAYTYTMGFLGYTTDYDYIVDVGVLAHETFHLISAPDLYHYYDYTWIDAIGYWGLMESIGSTPNHMLGYMKETYGNWISSVREITESGSYTLYPLQDSPNNLYRIPTGYSNEYVYLEYRDNDGLYESNLPDSGLIVYRVDLDYYDDGNVYGYYDEDGAPQNEVFVFRPGIVDILPPIEFEGTDDELIDEDGSIDDAALSNHNLYDEMGNNTDILMFYSDGTLMDMKIYNVVERNGYISFDVYLPPQIELETNIDIDKSAEIYLIDTPGLSYYVDITNVPDDADIYYTLDGTTPDMTSNQYLGGRIKISNGNNIVQLAVYQNSELISSVKKTYEFRNTIESEHNPYGDEVNTFWYIHLDEETEYSISFNSQFALENGYDFLSFFDGVNWVDYTNTELRDQVLTYNNNGILILFTSDYTESDYYGFTGTLEVSKILDFDLIGNSSVTNEVFNAYNDAGFSLDTGTETGYYVLTSDNVNINIIGEYQVTYQLYDSEDTLIDTIIRTVFIRDSQKPLITLNGDDIIYLEYNQEYNDSSVTCSDNYDSECTIVVAGDIVDTNVLGSYNITYNSIDSSGNIADEVTRQVIVQDTTAPVLSLNPSLDTIELNGEYTEYGVTATDFQLTTTSITGNVSTSQAGTYILVYTVEDASGNVSNISRYITVYNPAPKVEFILGSTLTTIAVNSEYADGTCQVSVDGVLNDCEVKSNNINTNVPGIYNITYSYIINEIEYTYKRYVFVYDDDFTPDLITIYYKEEFEGKEL